MAAPGPLIPVLNYNISGFYALVGIILPSLNLDAHSDDTFSFFATNITQNTFSLIKQCIFVTQDQIIKLVISKKNSGSEIQESRCGDVTMYNSHETIAKKYMIEIWARWPLIWFI